MVFEPGNLQVGETPIAFREGTERAVAPSATLARVTPFLAMMGITRIAHLTGLDRLGIPVVSVCRPNSRSLSISQGKGLTMEAARVSGVMEAIELYHAENVRAPLLLASYREMRKRQRTVDHVGLPRLNTGHFNENLSILWVEGLDMIHGEPIMVPYDLVHTDFRTPLPTGSGAFFMSSNGLASGNCLAEALSHALCEVVERDANTLFSVSARREQAARKVDLATVNDEACRQVLDRFEDAGIAVVGWESTTDVGIASFLCTVVDRDRNSGRPMPPVSGSGTHPRRGIALLRALTEAAQARLTIISGARDDLSMRFFDDRAPLATAERDRLLGEAGGGARSFRDVPEFGEDTFERNVKRMFQGLVDAGFSRAVSINLTLPEFGIPVVRLIVPHLEAMSEVPGYVLGKRAKQRLYGAT